MEYIISLATQTRGFLFSLGFGVIIGVLYDFLRIIRMTFTKRKIFIPIFDVVFVIASALLTFLFFLMVTDGEIRLYILFGELLGFSVYYFSFGVIAVRFCEKTVEKIKSVLKRIAAFVFKPFLKLFKRIQEKYTIFLNFLQKMSKKMTKNAKILLQKDKALLYNLTDKMRNCREKSPDYESDGDYEHKSKKKSN